MVARDTDAETRQNHLTERPLHRFLHWWRCVLTELLRCLSPRPKGVRHPDATTPAEMPVRSVRKAVTIRSTALVWAGALAVVVGAVGAVALAGPGASRSVAVVAAGMSLMWAVVRWALTDVVASHRTTLARADVRGACAAGSLVWVVALTPELRLFAWAVSGIVTGLLLTRLGANRRQTFTCVGIAWGAQAAVVVGSWLARTAIIAILATRG